jgi:hypothetical protein
VRHLSDKATALIGTIIGTQFTAIILLAVAIVRVREKLAKLEQRFDDKVNGGHKT